MPVDLATISAVRVENKGEVLQVTVVGSRPLSYSVQKHNAPPQITLDIPQARFVGLPTVLSVAEAGVKAIQLRQVSGRETIARLTLHLEDEKVHYSMSQDQEMLLLHIQPPARAAVTDENAMPNQVALPTLPASSQDYRVGPKDVLKITVYDEPDLSKTLRVSESGFIVFPLVGIVSVQGLTPAHIAKKLEHVLSPRYLLNPQVFVEVTEFESQKVFILGAVDKPQSFILRGKTTLLELLSETGRLGRGKGIGQSSTLVVFRQMRPEAGQDRSSHEETRTIRVDLDRLLRQGDLTLNLVLQAHDVLYIPEPDSVFVFGEVGKPGPILLPEGGMTLMEAIAQVGGFTMFAAPSHTKIMRVVDGEELTMRINVSDIIKRGDRSKDMMLKANDVVVVPTTLF